MTGRRDCAGLRLIWFVLLALAVPATGLTNATAPEELVVTARKREENLQSVPISVATLGREDLQVRDVISLERLAEQTPGLSFATAGSLVNRRAVIRGMSQQTRVGDETNVATFIDGVYTPGFSGAEFFGFDTLERIEVIKGPQSALYGRNSFAGAINYVTAKPRYETEAGAQLTAGSYDRLGVSAYISGPVIDDRLAVRVTAGQNETGGTHKNSINGEQLGNADTGYVLINTRIDPADNLRMGLSLSWQDEEVSPVPATLVADDDPRRIGQKQLFRYSPFELAAGGGAPIGRLYSGAIRNTSNTYMIDPRSFAGNRKMQRVALDLDWDLGAVSLISQTAYQEREVETLGDFNTCRPDIRAAVCDTVSPTATGTFFGGPLAGAPLIVNVLTGAIEDRDEFSQDLRLESNSDGALQWLAGAYYSTEDFVDETQRLSDGTLTNPDASIVYAVADPLPRLDSTTLIENTFLSFYASADYRFNEQWSLSLEGRYTREEKEADQRFNRFPTNVPPTGFLRDNFYFFTPRAILSWAPDDDTLWYVSAAKGVKSGGFNPGSVQLPTFDEEENWSYELGSKYTLLDGALRVNSALYFVDWDDQQITGTDSDNSRLPITQNVAKTEIFGFETEAFYTPTDWLQLNLGLSLLDAEYKEGTSVSIDFLTDCGALPIPCDEVNGLGPYTSGNLDGRKVIGTPETSFNAGAQVNRAVTDGGWDLVARLDYSWQDKIYIDEANAGYIPSRATVNLRLGLENEKLSVSGFCNNLTDDDTPVFALPPRDILGVPHFFVINRDGRLCGMQFAARY